MGPASKTEEERKAAGKTGFATDAVGASIRRELKEAAEVHDSVTYIQADGFASKSTTASRRQDPFPAEKQPIIGQ